MLDSAKKHPIVYDEDSPKLTPAELAEFHPVNGMSWKERAQIMQEAVCEQADKRNSFNRRV